MTQNVCCQAHDIVADDLLLTVMIAGDIVAELKAEMNRVSDKYNIENVKRLHEIGGECKSTTLCLTK